MDFDRDESFLKLLKDRQELILSRTTNKILESDGFKAVFAGLKSMTKENNFNGAKLILIAEDEIINVNIDEIKSFNDLFIENDFAFNHKIKIDKKLEIVSAEKYELPRESNKARSVYNNLSKDGDVVFFLLKDKVNYFINGIDNSESVFFSLADINSYNEKKDISELNIVLKKYQEDLKDRKRYCKFFIEKSHLKSLYKDLNPQMSEETFITNHAHILRNKPENTFRDDLRDFLNLNLKVAQVKEYLLESLKRLDIYIYDEFGEVYLIEVKWVGQSIHQEGKKLGTKYKANNITPEAFIQALNYIEELNNKEQNIVRAFLVVFDARKEDLDDTGAKFDEKMLSPQQKVHYRKFEKIKDLRVKNFHPS